MFIFVFILQGVLYLMGNPVIKKIKNYRKHLIVTIVSKSFFYSEYYVVRQKIIIFP